MAISACAAMSVADNGLIRWPGKKGASQGAVKGVFPMFSGPMRLAATSFKETGNSFAKILTYAMYWSKKWPDLLWWISVRDNRRSLKY